MRFGEVQVGQKFKLNDDILEKADLISGTCCRSASNAKLVENNSLRFIDDNTEVELAE